VWQKLPLIFATPSVAKIAPEFCHTLPGTAQKHGGAYYVLHYQGSRTAQNVPGVAKIAPDFCHTWCGKNVGRFFATLDVAAMWAEFLPHLVW